MKTWIFVAVILYGFGNRMAFCESSASKGDVLTATIAAIRNLLHFYKNNYDKSVNLDAVFGLRIIEGQLKLLVEDFNENSSKFAFSTANEVFSDLRQLSIEATKVANMAIPHLVEQDPKYFELLKYLVQEPWKVSKPHRFINQNFSWNRHLVPPGSVPEMSEKVSDLCLAQLTGARSNDKPQKPCDAITEECLRKFLQPQQFWYTLQHQILYTVVAQKMGCDKTIDEYITARSPESISLDHLQHVFCTNAFLDLEEYVSRFGIDSDFRDIFLEMQFICPSVGFFQFLRLDWLHKILEWQSPQGCFPADNKTTIVYSTNVVKIKPHVKPTTTTTTTTTTPSAVEPQHRNVGQPPPSYVPADNTKTARSWHESKPVAQVQPGPFRPIQHYEPRKQIPVPVMMNNGPPTLLHHAVVARHGGMYPQSLPASYRDAPMSPWARMNGYNIGQVPMNSHHPRANGWYGANGPMNVVGGAEERKDSPYQSEERLPDRGLKSVLRDGTIKRRRKRSDEGIVAYHDNEVAMMPQWRGLLREKSLAGGCLAHFTCVAAGALSMYLRYLLDPGPPEFSQHGLVNVWMSSHQPQPPKKPVVAAKVDFLPQGPLPRGPLEGTVVVVQQKGSPISGTYQRRWELPAVGDAEVGKTVDDGMPSYVHRSGVRKNLEDRVFILKKEVLTKVGNNGTEGGHEEEKETLSELQVEVRRMTLQSDLNHYLIIVTIVSLVCICMLFKYIYKRRMYFKNRLRHM